LEYLNSIRFGAFQTLGKKNCLKGGISLDSELDIGYNQIFNLSSRKFILVVVQRICPTEYSMDIDGSGVSKGLEPGIWA
jgi:hypothetical protein